MIKVVLGEKTYSVDFVSALALREIKQPAEILRRRQEESSPDTWAQDMDVLVKWFCLFFGNQFSPQDVYALYPADRLLTDVALAIMAVENRVSDALREFPTTPAAGRNIPQAKEA